MDCSFEDAPTIFADWLRKYTEVADQDKAARPNYFTKSPASLVTRSVPSSLQVGTADDIFSVIFPQLVSAESEILLVTCFWEKSESLKLLSKVLREVSAVSISRGTTPLRVRICFSARSILQQLFHSRKGHVYPPSSWAKLGLPSPQDIPGLDLRVKSIFIRPFSLIHSKFILVDRRVVYIPSANISRDRWFEGCISMTGPIVQQFLLFWARFWASSEDCVELQHVETRNQHSGSQGGHSKMFTAPEPGGPAFSQIDLGGKEAVPTVFLPSPHHRNPRFHPLPWQSLPRPPPTPLVIFLLHAISTAKSSIFIQSPDFACKPLLYAVLDALLRGVDVRIVTNQRVMLLEQLCTAATTTNQCLKTLVKRYKSLETHNKHGAKRPVGSLLIEHFHAKHGKNEPRHSHIKIVIIDSSCVVWGSGNMDRASWYTSQELSIGIYSCKLADQVMALSNGQLYGRTKTRFSNKA